ncbi:MAG: DUF2974 domain-containing protein [Tissierellia bacterium]|nr:DUF2974 domain-containing protein [Tissierellia bacterium]MDD4780533.1 DUF2974 domain-containing protein [Tissierellia bacterium]
MQNILDYIDWRGDISFEINGFNEVDNLIMSVLSYLEFDNIVPKDSEHSISLSKAAELFRKTADKNPSVDHNKFLKLVPELLEKAACSSRYSDIQLSCYEKQTDYEQSKQFSAVVFSINKNLHFISFRGTDDTIIGWQEDFQMSFMDEVQAQKQAVIYINRICLKLPGKFYFGGHSKGGNLAVYAAVHADEGIQGRIIGVFNNDGPGFLTNIIQSNGYQSIITKIITFVPKSSVIGMLLEHQEEYRVVSSNETGIMQHDAFSWEVKGTQFVYEDGLTKNSLLLNNTLRVWLSQLSIDERSQFVNAIFDIIQATGAKTFGELTKEKLNAADAMIKTYKNTDELTKLHMKKTIEMFFAEGHKTIRSTINDDFELMLEKSKMIKQSIVKKADFKKNELKRNIKDRIDRH